jgi:hypothetical protein
MKTAPQFHRLRRRFLVLDAALQAAPGIRLPDVLCRRSDTDGQLGIFRLPVNVLLPQQQKFHRV